MFERRLNIVLRKMVSFDFIVYRLYQFVHLCTDFGLPKMHEQLNHTHFPMSFQK